MQKTKKQTENKRENKCLKSARQKFILHVTKWLPVFVTDGNHKISYKVQILCLMANIFQLYF